MRGLDDLVRSGKVLYVGFSDTPAWVMSYAVGLSERYGWSRPVATQLPYNFASRDPEREIIPMGKALGLTVTAWGLLSGGELTGKYNDDNDDPKRYEGASDKAKTGVIEAARRLRRKNGRSPRPNRHQLGTTTNHVIPIPRGSGGPNSARQDIKDGSPVQPGMWTAFYSVPNSNAHPRGRAGPEDARQRGTTGPGPAGDVDCFLLST